MPNLYDRVAEYEFLILVRFPFGVPLHEAVKRNLSITQKKISGADLIIFETKEMPPSGLVTKSYYRVKDRYSIEGPTDGNSVAQALKKIPHVEIITVDRV